MRKAPLRCVVDTNVTTTANGANPGAPANCVLASAKALQAVMATGHVFIDDGGRIVAEYRANLCAKGQPGPGDAFLKWLLTYEWGGEKVTRVSITPKPDDDEDFEELPSSVDDHGELRAQNRGSYLSLEAPQGQWKPLKRWLACRRLDLAETLHPNLMLFGEWCYAVHSVRYTSLPDWFLVFDVYDGETGEFWSTGRRDALAQTLNLALVPRLGVGRYTLPELERMLAHSDLRDGPAEGLYVRNQEEGRLVARAKLVHPEFVQAINEHWSKRTIEPNVLAGDRREPWSWG